MTTYNGIECPCYGTLEEIHAALIKELEWTGKQVCINRWEYIVTEKGFIPDQSLSRLKREYDSKTLAEFLHTGTAILILKKEWNELDDPELRDISIQIVTTGKIPHVSKRCALCGTQLNQEDQMRGACGSCHAEAVR